MHKKHLKIYLMNKETYLIIAFDSTSHALDLEEKEAHKMQGRIIPLPREIDAGCGLCFASLDLDKDKWEKFLKDEKVQYTLIKEVTF